MTRWEYMTIGPAADALAEQMLDGLGAIGWELVAVLGTAAARVGYLKREIPRPAAPPRRPDSPPTLDRTFAHRGDNIG